MTTEAEVLARYYPEFVRPETDDRSLYWKSVEEYRPGDFIEHEGRTYVVKHSWPWWKPRKIQVYISEIIPSSPGSNTATK